jgi:probable rRNA maturation factor
MSIVRFNYADIKPVSIPAKRRVKEFVVFIFSKEGKDLDELRFIFCSDSFLLKMNQDFLKHDYYTDIITFDLSAGASTVGEVYISVDTVRDNSVEHEVSFQMELLRVIFHGALHLCGYKDKKKSEITVMRAKEDYYLRLYSQNN